MNSRKFNEKKMTWTYEYPRPALTVDIVIFGYQADSKDQQEGLSVLLVRRGIPPYKDCWALPGGFVQENEELDAAAKRELLEEAGLKNIYLEQLYTFGKIDRDPRERVVSVSYFALVKMDGHVPKAATDASDAKWFTLKEIPKLAFDHKEILKVARQRLQNKIRYEPIGFELLPKAFTLTQLQNLYECILEQPIDKRNFRKKILSFDVLKPLDKKVEGVRYRLPQLYSFEKKKYLSLLEDGHKFEV